jgi:HEAT repeat protein
VGVFSRPPRVEKLQRKGRVEKLVRALSYEDPVTDRDGRVVDLGTETRRQAAEALATLNMPGAYDGLLRALEDPEEIVRVTALRGLRERGDPVAVEQLTSAVTNWTEPQYARARQEALETLAFLRDPTAPRRVAAGLLTRTAELDEESDAPVLRRLTRAGGHDALIATIGDLIGRLREGNAPARTRTLLVWLAPESVEPLIEALPNVPARREAILALGEAHDSRAVERLCTVLLGDDEPAIRAAAARALGEIRDPAAVEALLLATGDPEYEIRTAASESFDRLGNAAVAVAMSVLVRPALENGASAGADQLAGGEEEPEAEEAPAEPEPEPAPEPEPVPQAARPTQVTRRPPVTQSLIRLLERWSQQP